MEKTLKNFVPPSVVGQPIHPKKSFKTKPVVDFLPKLPLSEQKDLPHHSMDEIRQVAVSMANSGLGPSTISLPAKSAPKNPFK